MESWLIHLGVDEHYSASTLSSIPGQDPRNVIQSPPHTTPHIHAYPSSTLWSGPSYRQLRYFHGKANPEVIPIRNTLPTRPAKPEWLRPVHGQHTFRKIACPDPSTWVTPSAVSQIEMSHDSSSSKRPHPVFGENQSSKPQAESKDLMKEVSHRRSHRRTYFPSNDPNGELLSGRAEPIIPSQSSNSAVVDGTFPEDMSPTGHGSPSLGSLPGIAEAVTSSAPLAGRLPSSERAETANRPSFPGVRHIKPPLGANQSPSPPSFSATRNLLSKPQGLQRLSHLTSTGDAHMVDISHKIPTRRTAAAIAFVLFSNPKPYTSLTDKSLPKGDALAVARIAGIQAAKKTAALIPLAHPGLSITGVTVEIELLTPSFGKHGHNSDLHIGESGFIHGGVKIAAQVSCDGKTGVEMEALTAANVAALTMYDMCKAVDKHMIITGVRVTMKRGGKSGHWSLAGDIPDPSPSPTFEPVLQRRIAGIVHDAETHPAAQMSDPASELEIIDDPPVAPEVTDTFLRSAANELDLFIANTTSPAKAAEIAGLRRSHKALTARIKDMQKRLEDGYDEGGGDDGGEGEQLRRRDGRVDFDVLQRLNQERRQIARNVLSWRIGAGSEIREANEREVNVFEQTKNGFAQKAAGQWRWEAGVYGVWSEKHVAMTVTEGLADDQ